MVDRASFEYPVYEVWARSTVNDGRSRHGGGNDEGEPFAKQSETRDITEARARQQALASKPSTVTQVRVRWDLDKAAYTEALERAQLAELQRKYPDAT